MNYFNECKTVDEAKKRFWELAKIHHPDKGGNTATFQTILNQFEKFKPETEKFKGETESFDGLEYAEIISQLIKISATDIDIEICGSWLWVSGNTYQHKDAIKAVVTGNSYKRGFSKSKSMWYFSPTGYRKFSKVEFSINEIRNLYGSVKVAVSNQGKLLTL